MAGRSRRIRVLRPGGLLIGGTLALGIATLNTGNNLLYLLLGSLLGLILLSGVLSERVLSGVTVRRRAVPPMTAGRIGRIEYVVTHRRRGLPAFSLEILDGGWTGVAFVPLVEPGSSVQATSLARAERRGVHPLGPLTVATSFPFGFFRKERRIDAPDVLVVRPRTDRPIRGPRAAAGGQGQGVAMARVARRGTFRALRPWRPGDDPRDVHWRSSARLPGPVVREYEPERGGIPWIVLDSRGPAAQAEAAIEIAASLAAVLTVQGRAWGFAAGPRRLAPEGGTGHLEAALDLMAALEASPTAPATAEPAPPGECILVAPSSRPGDWLDVYTP